MDMDCNTAKLVEDTFHMARETMGMVKPPRPRTKPVVTRGSPHSKKLQAHARIALGNAPATTRSSPGVGLARQQLEQAGRAGTLKGTGEELTAAGFCGGNIRDLEQEQQFTDKYIEPYCQPPPQIVHEQQPPALQSMRCPTVGVLQARKKRPVYLARTVVKVTYPKDEPVTGPLVTRQTMDLREKQSPGKKPWEWGGEEMYPGSSKSQKVINELKLKLTKLQRKLQETRTGAVRSREPTLASQKRYGNLKNPYVPSTRSLVPTRKEQEEQWELAARRRQYAIDRRRRLLEATPTSSPTTTRGAPHDPRPPHGTRSPVGGSPTSYHTANFESPGQGGSPSSFYSAANQSPPPGTTAASRPIGSPTPFKDVTQQDLQNDQYLREGRQRIIEALRQRQCAAEPYSLDVPDVEILDLKYSTQPVAGTNYFFKWTMEQYCYRSGKNSCIKRVNCQATYYVRQWENFAELQGPYCSDCPMTT